MMFKSSTTIRQLIERLLETLRTLPGIYAELNCWESVSQVGEPRCDAQISLQVAGNPFTLLIESKKTLYPRDVRQILWQYRNINRSGEAGQDGGEVVPLLVAESISLGAKELLRDERVGYYDSGGSLYMPASRAYVYIDKPPPKTLSKSMRSLFSGRRAQVLHFLLVHHQDWFGVKELAKEALVSSATASQMLTELERFDWLDSRGQGPNKERHLREPAALLDAWVKQLSLIRPPTLRRYYVPIIKTDKLLEHVGDVFASHAVEYAISYEAAAQSYTPFLSSVSQVRCRLLFGPASDAAIAELGARVVSEGANLVIIEAKSPGELLFRERMGGIWLASPIQVYLDLLCSEGRAKEMAEHLRRERIGF